MGRKSKMIETPQGQNILDCRESGKDEFEIEVISGFSIISSNTRHIRAETITETQNEQQCDQIAVPIPAQKPKRGRPRKRPLPMEIKPTAAEIKSDFQDIPPFDPIAVPTILATSSVDSTLLTLDKVEQTVKLEFQQILDQINKSRQVVKALLSVDSQTTTPSGSPSKEPDDASTVKKLKIH